MFFNLKFSDAKFFIKTNLGEQKKIYPNLRPTRHDGRTG
jgi:hypothetical protein